MTTFPLSGSPLKTRILFYAGRLDGGGAERVMSLLIAGLARRGYDVTIVTQHPPAVAEQGLVPPGVPRHVVGTGHAGAVLRLARLLRRQRPDVIVSALSTCNLEALLAATLAGMPRRLVQSVHGFADAEPGLLSQLAFRLLPVSSRLAAATVAVSDTLRDDLVTRFRADARRTLRLYNPVMVDNGAVPDATALAARPPLIVAVGRLEPVKDLPTLLRAVALVSTPGARLALLGEGSERAALKKLAADLGLEGRVDMPGWIADVGPWYDKGRVLAVSSRSESFALTLVEAMARGLPVVSVDSRGPREILADGRHGALVPPGDPQALAQALEAALAAPGDPASRHVRAGQFALEPTLDQWEALIARVMAGETYQARACADPHGAL